MSYSRQKVWDWVLVSGLTVAAILAVATCAFADATLFIGGDSGTLSSGQTAVRNRMVSVANARGVPEAFIHTGDMVYSDGQASGQGPRFFDMYQPLFDMGMRYAPCLGNHDARNRSVWSDVHNPTNHPLSLAAIQNPAGDRSYYTTELAGGLAFLAMIDSNNGSSSVQKAWIRGQLCASTAPWKFAAFHHTSYSSSHHGSSSTMRAWDSIFRECGVDVVWMGHDHYYERTKPQGSPPITFVTTGGLGASLYDLEGSETFTAFAASFLHFTRVEVTPTSLCWEAISDTGAIRDSHCLSATPGGPTTTTVPSATTTSTVAQSTTTTTSAPPLPSTTTTTLVPPPGTLRNGGFEAGEADWMGQLSGDNNGEARVVTTGPCEGTRTMAMFDSASLTRARWQDVAVEPGQTYTLTWKFSTKNLGTSQGALEVIALNGAPGATAVPVFLPAGTATCLTGSLMFGTASDVTAIRIRPTLRPVTNGTPSNDAEVRWDAFVLSGGGIVTPTTTSTTTTSTTTTTIGPCPVCPPCTTTTTLQTGSLVLTGVYAGGYESPSLSAGTRVDASLATFHDTDNRRPLVLDGGSGVSLRGGKVVGQYASDSTWTYMHEPVRNHGGVEVEAANATVELTDISNVADALRFREDGFRARGVHASDIFDDCVDNHEAVGGAIEDSLFEGCYVGVSARPNVGQNGSAKTLRVERCLFELTDHLQPHASECTAAGCKGHGAFFKWSDGTSPGVVLNDNVFMVSTPTKSESGNLGIPARVKIVSCRNNVIVWLGAGPFKGTLGTDPATGQPCARVVTDRSVWDMARLDWAARRRSI